jgi:hypothetical protein
MKTIAAIMICAVAAFFVSASFDRPAEAKKYKPPKVAKNVGLIEFVPWIFSIISTARWSRGADASNLPRPRSITPRFCRLSATDSESGPSIFSAI